MPSSTAALAALTAVLDTELALLEVGLGGRADLDDGDATGELRETLLELLTVQSESVFSISRLSCPTRVSMSASVPAPSTIVVSSLVTTTRRALPSRSRPASLSVTPMSAVITVPAVTTARSSRNALRRSPKNGAFTATALMVLRIEFTTRVESDSPSISSAMIRTGLPDSAIFSSSGRNSGRELIFSR